VRLEAIADAGGICVSERVKDYALDQLEVLFDDAGEHQLKNIDQPVRACHVRFDRPAKIKAALTVPSKPSAAQWGLADRMTNQSCFATLRHAATHWSQASKPADP
jgi:hypothetical protein